MLPLATREASLSNGVGGSSGYRLGSVLFHYDNRKYVLDDEERLHVYEYGHNSYDIHPLTRFYKYPHMHAETHAILNRGMVESQGCDMLVTRILKNNKNTMAKPCNSCLALMKEAGIINAYYTNWDGDIECIKVQDT